MLYAATMIQHWVDEALGIFVLLLIARWSWLRSIQMQVALHLVILVLLVHFHNTYHFQFWMIVGFGICGMGIPGPFSTRPVLYAIIPYTPSFFFF